jgi:radical SAM family uncharacterized protein/radical SAM-linked protein
LGTEINALQKDPDKIRLRFALAFPDLYEVGMSHLGIQILYHILNAREEIAGERVFAPRVDLEGRLRAEGIPLCSLESGTPLSDFDIIGFSLLYELNFTNILTMLELSRVPFLARERLASHPFVIAGGPCTFNPEPMADFFDAMVIGDGEVTILELADAWVAWDNAGGDRQELLTRWSRIRGVYVPSFFKAHFDAQGFQVLTPRFPEYGTVHKALVSDLNRAPYPDHPVVSFGHPVHDRLSLEICRGCTRGCRFCQAGMIYRPVRERAPHAVVSLARRALGNTGYEDLSLLSLSAGDYSAIQVLIENLMNHCEPQNIAVSLPSLRVESLTSSLMRQIKRVRKTGFTIAPEAGSQRLREVINKDLSEQDLEQTVKNAFGLGWQVIKLYFMIGLPTETEADLSAIVDLVTHLKKDRPSGRRGGKINVSVSTFIPKPHTPFQWCPQTSLEESRAKIHFLRARLRGSGVHFKWQNPQMSLLEGLWARGDRRLGPLLVKAYEIGCRFDAWSEHFQYKRWQEAMQACDVAADFYTTRIRDLSEPLPWDHIDIGVSKDFLGLEWEKALKGEKTPDCRDGECHLCGICDFETVRPVTFEANAGIRVGSEMPTEIGKEFFQKLRVSYAKRGAARYFGHLELVKIFMRAFRRAGIPLRFSTGFHPAPKVSFETALPVGTESLEEHFTVQVPTYVSRETLMRDVNQELPQGLTITGCSPAGKQPWKPGAKLVQYTVATEAAVFSEGRLTDFLESQKWPLIRRNRKGRTKTIDLKAVVKEAIFLSPKKVQILVEEASGNHVRPADILACVFELPEEELKLANIIRGPVSTRQ